MKIFSIKKITVIILLFFSYNVSFSFSTNMYLLEAQIDDSLYKKIYDEVAATSNLKNVKDILDRLNTKKKNKNFVNDLDYFDSIKKDYDSLFNNEIFKGIILQYCNAFNLNKKEEDKKEKKVFDNSIENKDKGLTTVSNEIVYSQLKKKKDIFKKIKITQMLIAIFEKYETTDFFKYFLKYIQGLKNQKSIASKDLIVLPNQKYFPSLTFNDNGSYEEEKYSTFTFSIFELNKKFISIKFFKDALFNCIDLTDLDQKEKEKYNFMTKTVMLSSCFSFGYSYYLQKINIEIMDGMINRFGRGIVFVALPVGIGVTSYLLYNLKEKFFNEKYDSNGNDLKKQINEYLQYNKIT